MGELGRVDTQTRQYEMISKDYNAKIINGKQGTWIMIEDLNDSNLNEKISNAEKPLIVEFWDPWCGMCAEIAPVYEELAKKYTGMATFTRLNMRDNKASPDEYQVYITPSFIFFKKGKEVGRTGGHIEPEALEGEFRKFF
jgi:thioredoxin 1